MQQLKGKAVKERSIDEWQDHFASQRMEDLIAHAARSFPQNIAELTALYGRFVDIAFNDATESNHVRVLAACWAKAIESVVEVGFPDGSRAFEAFVAYRDNSKTLAVEHGYGTLNYVARHDAEQLVNSLGSNTPSPTVAATAKLLNLIAFGPHPND